MHFSDTELEGYLDEALPAEEMTRIETAVRGDVSLVDRLTEIHARRDAGIHTLGGIWRRHRLTCPSREQLGSFLLGTLDRGAAEYVTFHVETIGCRICQANVEDLRNQQQEAADSAETRRRKYFQSSAGYLRSK
jgi:hypothetical protein